MKISYSYLKQQFFDIDRYLEDIRAVVAEGDFTLGRAVEEFERRFARLCHLPYAIGVGSGTDALCLSLKALGVGQGDEVITSPNTFIATVGAIVMTGARPVFVDNNETYTIDVSQIEQAITAKTRAIMPVHLTGRPADMQTIRGIADRHGLGVIEDAAQAILASIDGKHVGSWGEATGFSLHPLKNLNIWGDGGVIVTHSEATAEKLRLLRNHGLATREEVVVFGHNSRLDSVQAAVANRLLPEVEAITERRIQNALFYDEAFSDLKEFLTIPPRDPLVKQVYHTYVILAKERDRLLEHLRESGISVKIHYPIPLHLQPAAARWGYREGDFPVCERHCRNSITLPVHQHLSHEELEYVTKRVREFYLG